MRAGRFYCSKDVRLDFPYDEIEYMAFWASHDCKDWDLYLSLIMDQRVADFTLTYAGAEPSPRRGCYETYSIGQLSVCEFYLPNEGDKFGILF